MTLHPEPIGTVHLVHRVHTVPFHIPDPSPRRSVRKSQGGVLAHFLQKCITDSVRFFTNLARFFTDFHQNCTYFHRFCTLFHHKNLSSFLQPLVSQTPTSSQRPCHRPQGASTFVIPISKSGTIITQICDSCWKSPRVSRRFVEGMEQAYRHCEGLTVQEPRSMIQEAARGTGVSVRCISAHATTTELKRGQAGCDSRKVRGAQV